MAHVIKAEDCTNCGVCEDDCPTECISEKGDVRVINADECIDCAACVDACPTECISEAA